MTTAKRIAQAAGIFPRTKNIILHDEWGIQVQPLLYGWSRFDMVMIKLRRPDLTPELSQREHIVAEALAKSIESGRMNPGSALRIKAYTPYQLCKLVARIAAECPETTIGGICDGWLARNHHTL